MRLSFKTLSLSLMLTLVVGAENIFEKPNFFLGTYVHMQMTTSMHWMKKVRFYLFLLEKTLLLCILLFTILNLFRWRIIISSIVLKTPHVQQHSRRLAANPTIMSRPWINVVTLSVTPLIDTFKLSTDGTTILYVSGSIAYVYTYDSATRSLVPKGANIPLTTAAQLPTNLL